MKKDSLLIETIAIGDELLTGKIADTNSAFVASQLFREGFVLAHQTVIADDSLKIQNTLKERAQRADVVLVFGGLGPTSDDKTASTVADLLQCSLVEDPPSKERLIKFLKDRNRQATPQVLKQIIYPEKCAPIFNSMGLAVGFEMQLGNCTFFFMPGVPTEMKVMFKDFILSKVLQKGKDGARVFHHLWKCLDIPESELQRLMDPVEKSLPASAYLGYRTRFPENQLTLYLKANQKPAEFSQFVSQISKLVAPYAYTEEDATLEELILKQLQRQNKKIVFAESCTGGLTCQRLTGVSGASQSVFGAYTPYQVEAKDRMLGVQVSQEGAVSKEASFQLAEKAKKISGADIAASITGYMGPTGGTTADPIGTMYLCILAGKTYERRIFQPWPERSEAQWGASMHLLNLIYKSLQD